MSTTNRIETQETPKYSVRDWNEEKVATLKRMQSAGASASTIANALGTSRNAVFGKLHRLGLNTGKAKMPNRAKRYGKPPPHPDRKTPFRAPKPPAETRQRNADGKLPADDISQFETPSDGRGIALFDLRNDTCRWPKGDVGEPDFAFCGDTADLSDGRPYCNHHMRIRLR